MDRKKYFSEMYEKFVCLNTFENTLNVPILGCL